MVDAIRLQSFADRILSLKADEDEIKKEIRGVYEEALGADVDKTGLGQLVTYLRKREKNSTDFDAKEAIFLGYLELYNVALTRAHAYARAKDGEVADGAPSSAQPNTAETPNEMDRSIDQPKAEPTDVLSGKRPEGEPVNPEAGAVIHAEAGENPAPIPHPVEGTTPTSTADGDRGAVSSLAAAPVVDRTKPNPICRDPSDCGVEASWNHTCLQCLRIKSQGEAQVALQ